MAAMKQGYVWSLNLPLCLDRR